MHLRLSPRTVEQLWMTEKIAIYLPSLRGGGAERVMLDIAKGFAQRGALVDLLLVQAKGPYIDLVPTEVRLIDLHARGVATSFPRLVRYLQRERPVALLSTLSHANVGALLAKRFFRKGLRVIVRQASNFTMDRRHGTFKERIVLELTKRLLPSADAIIAGSQGVADDLRSNVPSASHLIHVIGNPVVSPDCLVEAEVPVTHPWFRPGQPPIVLAAGRLVPQKDYPTLLRAFAGIVKRRRAHLVILGEGPLRSELSILARELGIEKDIDFPGFQLNPFAYMSKAQVFVLSSVWEGLPNALIQAMACGTPVVSTDCPSGPGEILDGGLGRLVPVGNPEALADGILETLDNPVNREHLMHRAEAFNADVSISQYFGVVFPAKGEDAC